MDAAPPGPPLEPAAAIATTAAVIVDVFSARRVRSLTWIMSLFLM